MPMPGVIGRGGRPVPPTPPACRSTNHGPPSWGNVGSVAEEPIFRFQRTSHHWSHSSLDSSDDGPPTLKRLQTSGGRRGPGRFQGSTGDVRALGRVAVTSGVVAAPVDDAGDCLDAE